VVVHRVENIGLATAARFNFQRVERTRWTVFATSRAPLRLIDMPLRSPRCAVAGLAATVLLCLPAAALADPPANDNRATPRVLKKLPAQVTGTTVDATRADSDPSSTCA
jgi:hypothetical protein